MAASAEDFLQVELGKDDKNKVIIRLKGATVISWKLFGTEILFVSDAASFDSADVQTWKPIRGGIPIVFPYFGSSDIGPHHGFARIHRWSILKEPHEDEDGNPTVVLCLEDNEITRKMWNFKFRLEYMVKLNDHDLITTLTIVNTDKKDFDFQAVLHTYFATRDVTGSMVNNLHGLTYIDKARNKETHIQSFEHLMIAGHTHKVYKDAPDEVTLLNVGLDGDTDIAVKKVNFPDLVVWNPWKEVVKGKEDFAHHEYPYMISVEPGVVHTPVKLTSGESYTGSQVISINTAHWMMH
ncbi:uncharacterized protein LOC141904937 [Tubulanus polymorphus]|uniref:uncharacterized protein LOC141904937 n=1 Tax=Tubulanus polymorphus TaxID=672921 RepID=UPI003DA2E601